MENWKKKLYCFAFAFTHIYVSIAWARKTDNGKLVNIMRGEEKLHFNVFVSEYIFINILGEHKFKNITSAKVVIPLKNITMQILIYVYCVCVRHTHQFYFRIIELLL